MLTIRFRYNATEHPIPFHKAQDLGKVPKKLAGGPAPDIEEAYDVCYWVVPALCPLGSDLILFSSRTMFFLTTTAVNIKARMTSAMTS